MRDCMLPTLESCSIATGFRASSAATWQIGDSAGLELYAPDRGVKSLSAFLRMVPKKSSGAGGHWGHTR